MRQILAQLPPHRFVLKTDVKSYYASIDHVLLHEQLSKHIPDKGVLRLLWHYMRRCAERGGMFYDIECGISLGCPLSPLMGALFLQMLDERMELFYLIWTTSSCSRPGLLLPIRLSSVSFHVRSGFMSKSRGSLSTPPSLARTCNGGAGGQRWVA